jgi:hypothetical protein
MACRLAAFSWPLGGCGQLCCGYAMAVGGCGQLGPWQCSSDGFLWLAKWGCLVVALWPQLAVACHAMAMPWLWLAMLALADA